MDGILRPRGGAAHQQGAQPRLSARNAAVSAISALSSAASFSGLVTCTASTIGVPSGVHAMPTLLLAPYEPPPVLSATVHVLGRPARRRLPLVVLLSSQWVRSARSGRSRT